MQSTLHEAQATIARDRHRFRVVNCGRRFGKTTLAVWEMFAVAVAKDEARVAYIAPTYQQARDIAWAELKRVAQDATITANESRLELTVSNQHGGTSLIVLRGWEAVETLRGQRYDFLVLDEISSYRNFWGNWQEVLRPTLTDRRGEGLFISTPKGFNHFYDLYGMELKDDDFKSFHFTTYDNPHIPVDEIDKAKKELTEDRFAQEYLADFRKTEGLVYKEFNRGLHIVDEIPQANKTFGGLDFGFTNPAAALTIKKDRDARYYVSAEWYKRGQTDTQIADYVAALSWAECYPDPASASGVEELKRRNINVREVVKGADSIRNGISVVRELFKQGRLFIHKDCVNLIAELETYSYPDKKPDKNDYEEPIKENDHALDALRYALMMETVAANDNVDIGLRAQFDRNTQLMGLNSAR
jgi:PBSX family phage terminase large subunit